MSKKQLLIPTVITCACVYMYVCACICDKEEELTTILFSPITFYSFSLLYRDYLRSVKDLFRWNPASLSFQIRRSKPRSVNWRSQGHTENCNQGWIRVLNSLTRMLFLHSAVVLSQSQLRWPFPPQDLGTLRRCIINRHRVLERGHRWRSQVKLDGFWTGR